MIPSHRERLRALSDDALTKVAELMDVPPTEFVIDALESRGLCQADVVMALLRAGCSDYVRELATLTKLFLPQPWPRPLPRAPARLPPGQWWVEWHEHDLTLGGEGRKCCNGSGVAKQNKFRVRCGMTVEEMSAAGATRSELTGAVRGGRLRMSGELR
jgi:hypothetical protein